MVASPGWGLRGIAVGKIGTDEGGHMCWERFSDKFRATETRVTDVRREEELVEPDVWREPTEEPVELRERDKELAEV